MADASEISVGLAHEFVITGCKAGFTSKDFAELAHSENRMSAFLGVLRGTHEIRPVEHMIDLGGAAKLPFEGATCEWHSGTGIFKVERRPNGIYLGERKLGGLFRAKEQKKGVIIGHDLRKECERRDDLLPATVLDFMVAHPEFWPEEWKKDAQGNTLYVFFFNDVFRSPAHGNLFVRYGYWLEGEVVSDYGWLGHGFDSNRPVASLAS